MKGLISENFTITKDGNTIRLDYFNEKNTEWFTNEELLELYNLIGNYINLIVRES